MTDQPRQPAGAPEGGQFAGTEGAESTSGLFESVGQRVDNELRSILEHVMVERQLGTPGTPSDDERINAAVDWMQLPDFADMDQQARWALEDVRNAAEVDTRAVKGEYGDEDFAHERLARGELVRVTYSDGDVTLVGDAYRSSTTGKVWFIAEDPYPDAYRGDGAVDDKMLALAGQATIQDLNLDPNDPDNDYDVIFEIANHDEEPAQVAWDFAQQSEHWNEITVADVVKLSRKADSVPLSQIGPGGAGAHYVEYNGERRMAFRNSARPDHVWLFPAKP